LVRLWDPGTGAATGSFVVSDQAVYAVRFTPDGRRLALAGADGAIYLRAADGLALASLRGHAGAVFDVDFDPTGDTVVSAGTDGTVRTWTPEHDVHLREPMTSATFDRTATRIVAGAPNGRLHVWAVNGLRPLLDLPDHSARSFAGFSTDATRIISYGEDGRVNVRAAGNGQELAMFNPQMGPVWSIASDHADRRLVIGGDNGAVQIVDYGGAVLETLSGAGSPAYSVAFGPDDQTVAAGRDDGTITLWGPQRAPITITAVDGAVNSVAFSPDGSLIASAHDSGSIHLMDLRGNAIAVLRGHSSVAYAVRFRSDGQQLVSGGGDGVVRVWDTRTGELLREFDPGGGPADSVDIGPDGARILKSSEKGQTLRLLTCQVCGSLDSVVALARSHPSRPLTPDEEHRFVS
jgi:WD40 repeat protein